MVYSQTALLVEGNKILLIYCAQYTAYDFGKGQFVKLIVQTSDQYTRILGACSPFTQVVDIGPLWPS